jgi:hypothetical protein
MADFKRHKTPVTYAPFIAKCLCVS